MEPETFFRVEPLRKLEPFKTETFMNLGEGARFLAAAPNHPEALLARPQDGEEKKELVSVHKNVRAFCFFDSVLL